MHLILFDTPQYTLSLRPFTFTRPVAAIRVGIWTIAQKWQYHLQADSLGFLTAAYLATKFPKNYTGAQTVFINGALCPDAELKRAVQQLKNGEVLTSGDSVVALKTREQLANFSDFLQVVRTARKKYYTSPCAWIDRPQQIFKQNGTEIVKDFACLSQGKQSEKISDKHTRIYHESNIFVAKGVSIHAATLNAEHGPIYLAAGVTIEEGSVLKGPVAIGEGTVVNIGAKIRANTTIGPHCKVGGEINNTVFMGYSNKAHDGFLSNSVIGEWCNLGADTNSSNLKNNYSNVRVWSYASQAFIDSGEMFLGLLMADYCRCGINTMFNTGTLVGVGATIFGSGFPPKFIPSFCWGGTSGFDTVKLIALFETNRKAMQRRKQSFGVQDEAILQKVFEMTAGHRKIVL